jgi:hypothetical protein
MPQCPCGRGGDSKSSPRQMTCLGGWETDDENWMKQCCWSVANRCFYPKSLKPQFFNSYGLFKVWVSSFLQSILQSILQNIEKVWVQSFSKIPFCGAGFIAARSDSGKPSANNFQQWSREGSLNRWGDVVIAITRGFWHHKLGFHP